MKLFKLFGHHPDEKSKTRSHFIKTESAEADFAALADQRWIRLLSQLYLKSTS